MRFGTSKTQTEERNWSLILNPLRSELDKRRVAEKISELFHLAFEEARELAQSTPLILLDELSHPIAQQVQVLFQEIRADVTLTNDALVKRRCYRAVWPELPSLSFLHSETPPEEIPEKLSREMPKETAAAPAPSAPALKEKAESSPAELQDLGKKYTELELLYKEKTRQNEELKLNLEKDLPWEERYQNLKEEYQETRALYEEKIQAREKEFEAFKAQLMKELNSWKDKITQLEKQNKDWMERLNHLESAKEVLTQAVQERSDELGLWREKYHTLAQKSERFESLFEEERKRRSEAEEATRKATELVERTRRETESQAQEAERWKKKFQELDESQERLEQEFSQFSEEQNTELKRLQEANHELEARLENAQRQTRDLMFQIEQQDLIEKRSRLAHEVTEKESRLRELAKEIERLRQEIKDREVQAETLGTQQADLEREVLEVKQAQRHLLEQSKLKEKGGKLKRSTPPVSLNDSFVKVDPPHDRTHFKQD